jgi:addiction module HigA family antidote
MEFLQPMGLSQVELAKRMQVPLQRVNTLVNGKREVTAGTAISLSCVLKTSSEFWMNLKETVMASPLQALVRQGALSANSPPTKRFLLTISA